jgi:hypothetical protein
VQRRHDRLLRTLHAEEAGHHGERDGVPEGVGGVERFGECLEGSRIPVSVHVHAQG